MTPQTLPLQPATAPRRRVDRTCYCSIPYCATAAHGRRARGRVSLATTSCLGRSDQTSAGVFQHSTQARKRNTTPTHLSCEQGGAERLQHAQQSSTRKVQLFTRAHTRDKPVQHGPEQEAQGCTAPRGAVTNSRGLWVTSKCCGKNGEHDTSSCKCPQNVFSQRNWIRSSPS